MNIFSKISISICIFLFNNTLLISQQIIKIPVNPLKVTTETNCGNAKLLFDEQIQAGDPKNGNGGNIQNTYSSQIINTWECGYGANIQYPAYAYIDLGKIFKITNIYLRDVNNKGLFSVFYGYPGNWNFLLKDSCKGYNSWNAHTLNNIETRYLRFKRDNDCANIAEIVLYGYDLNSDIDSISPSNITDLKIDTIEKNKIKLKWTPSIDSHLAFYEIRYNNSPITKNNYLNSIKSDSLCKAVNTLEKQYFNVNNLNSGTPYFFAVVAYDSAYNYSEISNIAFAKTIIDTNAASQQIIIEPEMLVNEMAIGNVNKLADEQIIVKNNIFPNLINNYWDFKENNAANSWHFPVSAVIDLGNYFDINSIAFYNQSSVSTQIKVYFNKLPFKNSDSIIINLDTVFKWKTINNLDFSDIRFIRISASSINTKIGEVFLWGKIKTDIQENIIPNSVNRRLPLMKDFIGINGFNNEPIGKLNCAGFIREYHNWEWNEGSGTSYNQPYKKGNIVWDLNYWNFDIFYENIKNQGLGICPVIQNNVPWLTNYNGSLFLTKPVDAYKLDPKLPSTYKNHANFMYQMAARYGSKNIENSKLQLKSDQVKKSGLDFIKYYENWNEQNKWWKGRSEFFSPYEYSAMTSADYDGHENTLYTENHNNLGLKTADPYAKLVMGGLAEGSIDYIKAMAFWSKYNRNDKTIPIDVINTHSYFNKSINNILQGISPEDFNIKEKMEIFAKFRDKYMPYKEVWLSEFGYNTSSNTIYSVPEISSCTREETQARWLVRSFLELAASGIDKAILYRLSDEENDNATGNTFCTTGLTYKKSTGYLPKISWFYVYTLKNNLYNFRFSKEIASSNNNVKIYEYTHDSLNQKAYAIWCPTSIDQSINNYTFNLPSSSKNMRIIEFQNNSISGLQKDTLLTNNQININVTEKPLLLITSSDSSINNEVTIDKKIILDSTMIFDESNKTNAKLLVDEQFISAEPFLGSFGNPVTNWITSYNSNDFPASAYIDLGYERNISQIFLYDSYSSSKYEISYGNPSNWTVLYSDYSKLFQEWAHRVVNIKTRYLRITVYSNASLNEIILYEK